MTANVTQVTVSGDTTVIGVSGSVTAPVVAVNVTATPVIQATIPAIPTVTVAAGVQGPPGPAGNVGLPSQTSNGGKYLTTDGTNLSWATVTASANLNSFSVVTASPGTEGLTYNNTTGVFTFTPTNAITTFSVTTASAGTQGLGYNSGTGVFTFTPADLSGYVSSSTMNSAISIAINNLINSAPSTLDTLGEIATLLQTDTTAISAITTTMASKISLTSLSVTTASASGGGSLSYNNANGVFTFTPPNLSSYLTSITNTQITNALGFTPYNSINPNNYITTSGVSVTTASASGGGSLSYNNANGVFTFTPASIPVYTITTASASGGGSLSLTGSTFTFTPPALSSYITTSSLSVTTNSASGAGSLSYTGGVFTFTPAAAYTLPTASTLVLGGVKVDGTTITITSGVITAVSSAPALTVTTNAASGGGALSYNAGVISFTPASIPTVPTYTISTAAASGGGSLSLTGSTFTFTPPNLSSYLTSITSSNVTTALGYTPLQSTSLSVTTASASGAGALSYSGGVFTFTPASIPTYTITTGSASGGGSLSLTGSTFTFNPAVQYSLTSAGIQTAFGSSLTANTVYASPNGSTGSASFRTLVAADIPTLAYSSLTGTPTLATVATSGSYADLTNKPTIPAAATWPVTNTNGASGPSKVSIGTNAGLTSQGVNTVAIGNSAGQTSQGNASISIGLGAGGSGQGDAAIAIGLYAGSVNQGANSIAIGNSAGLANTNAQAARTIILNASGTEIDGVSAQTDSFYVAPIRTDATPSNVLYYNTTTKEVTYGTAPVNYTLPTATTSVLGGVKVDGTTITINGSGVISGSSSYTLPTASGSVLGGIKIGTGLSIDGSGVVTASGSLPTQTGNSGKYLTTDGTTASWATVAGGSTFTGGTVANATTFQSNVTFSSSTAIIGDFDNAVTANRTLFTTATTNASTGIYAVPNGTSTSASWQALNNSTPTNASKILIAAGSTDVQLVSGINGSGTYLPLSFLTSGTTQMQLTTAGVLNVNAETINGTGMNLVYPSVGFNATYYTATAVTVTANNILAPDGATAGALITGSGASSTHAITVINATYVATGFSTSTLTRTYSCYFQKGTNNFVQMTSSSDTTVYANFDLNNGVLGTVGAGCTAAISAVAGYAGWYRCSITTSNSSFSLPGFYLITTATAARAESNTLATTIYAWGMQCEFGSAPRTYVPSTVAFVYGTPSLQINNNTVLSLDTAGSLNLGSSSNSTIALGNLATAVNIATGLTSTTAQTVSIATGTNTGVKTINIGTGGGGTNITMGLASSGTTTINSSSIQSGAATASLFTVTSSNISFATAATTLAIGSTGAGAVTTLNAPTVIGSNVTQNLYNTVATTVNEFGVATAINVASAAASATTWTLGNSNNSNTLTVAGGASSGTASISTVITTGTVNLLTGVITGGTINIGGAGSNVAVGGYLTMPSRPAFRVIGNGGAIIATTTVTSTNWTLDFQQGTALNTTTGIFTAPVAGLYQVNLVMRANSNSSSTISQAIVIKNASTSLCMLEFAPNTTMNHAGVSTIAQLAVGDTIKVVVAVGTLSFDGNDNWSVAFIG